MTDIPFALLPCGDLEQSSEPSFDVEITGRLTVHPTTINVQYHVTGDINDIQIPLADQQGERRNELWLATCFELFVSAADNQQYWEYNLSPAHHWAVFHFTNYRETKTDEASINKLSIVTQQSNDHHYELSCSLPLPAAVQNKKIEISVCAIIQDIRGRFHYYALIHCDQKADFHNRKSFIIGVDPGNS
ncbi:MAG: DOMON-like domain-containing protein [Gammaproteobacteria bacterium]|jgi:hypothetical protein